MRTDILPHHKTTIKNLINAYENDPRFLGLIIGGSVAKGYARVDSDVDFMIIATDETYENCNAESNLFINRTDLATYDGGFVDGKIINMDYLNKVAATGNEPSRAAFDGAFLGYSRLDNLDTLLSSIPIYPETNHHKRIKSFYAMAFIQNWLMGEANRHNNIYTMTRAASQLSLFAGRLILAHNRVLFPYHKWFLNYIEKCPNKPKNFIKNITTLLESPNAKTARVLFQSLKDFNDWNISDHEAYMWFMEDVEWSWMDNTTPLEDL
ncbi:nucleotidyltransferase domain-containing protein [Psychroserpens sp. MEBiC05023]